MASQSTTTNEEAHSGSKESEELTREKLITKYKTLLALTNKIKAARNDALAENESLKTEVEALNEKIKVLSKKNVTAEEMLAALTEQKLQMAMDIDDLKKEKHKYNSMKENAEKESAELRLKLKDMEIKEMQLLDDVKKLHENNEHVIILCSNVRKEKMDLQNELEGIHSSMNQIEVEKNAVFDLLSKQFNKPLQDINGLKLFFDEEINAYCSYKNAEEMNVLLDKNLNLKNKVEELDSTISALLKEKECAEMNTFNLSNKLQKLQSELGVVTSDRDQIMNNMEHVRLETKNLIENSEKLAEELETLKSEKIKNEKEMNVLLNSKNEEIGRTHNKVLEIQQQNEELKANLLTSREFINILETKTCDCSKENCLFDNDNVDALKEPIENETKNHSDFFNKFATVTKSFNRIFSSIHNTNFTLLLEELDNTEAELTEVINKFNVTHEEYKCPNLHCSCVMLKNVSMKFEENLAKYEKMLANIIQNVSEVKEPNNVLSFQQNNSEQLNELANILQDKINLPEFQKLKDEEMVNCISRMEDYYALDSSLEKRISCCREELGFALNQLHNAEESGDIMQRKIHSLQKHLSEVISDKELLNEVVNEKVESSHRLHEQLIEEQRKSSILFNDLESAKIELSEAKKAFEKYTFDIKNENVVKISEIKELQRINQNLLEDNASLKLDYENKLKLFDVLNCNENKNKIIIKDLENLNENLRIKVAQSQDLTNNLNEKVLVTKTSACYVKKDFMLLKQQFCDLREAISGHLCSIDNANKEIISSIHKRLHIAAERKDTQSTGSNTEELEIASESGRGLLVDKESQTNELPSEITAEEKKGTQSPGEGLSIKSGEIENLIDLNAAKVPLLEASLALAKQELATAQVEINQLREEFYCYRLRAQALLAKQKGESQSQGEKEANEQVEKLNNELESVRVKMEIILLEDESLKNRLSTLLSEKEIVDKKYEDVSKALHQKIVDYDTLSTEYNAFKLSTDTLMHNGKILLEEKYKSEISTKEATINKLKQELKEKHIVTIQDDKSAEIPESPASVHNMDEVLQEREDGEGSETVPAPFNDRHEFIPLDVLISNPVDDGENQVAHLQEQVNMLMVELSTHGIRSKHLSSLLREAEKESARNAQQNTVLKEELRRLERCLERQPLVANTEYLKNIVFKFLTLQSADERSRLVPVLDSILKLSPTETQKLNEIAKGEGNSRWGSYLHSWTGL